MKRPLFTAGLPYMLALALASLLDIFPAFLLGGVCLLAGLGLLWLRKDIRSRREVATASVLICLTAALGFAASAGYRLAAVTPVEALAGQEVTVSGRVVSQPERGEYRTSFLLRVESCSLPSAPDNFTLRFSGGGIPECEAYDRITATVRLGRLSDESGGIPAGYWLARGAAGTAQPVGGCRVERLAESDKPLAARLLAWNAELSRRVDSAVKGEGAGLAVSVITGDRSGLEADIRESFRLTGTSHLLALSGMHLSLLTTALLSFGLAVAIPKKICYTVCGIFTVFYMALVGFPFSILRAGIMLLLALLGRLLLRGSDPLNALGAAILLICLPNPMAAGDLGLQLSAVTTLGIELLSSPMAAPVLRRLPEPGAKRSLRRLLLGLTRGAVRSLSVSLAAGVAALPLLALTYGSTSLVGPLATLLTGWLLPWIMVPGLLAGLLAPIRWLGWLSGLLGSVTGLAAGLMLWIIRSLGSLPLVCVFLRRGYLLVWTALTGGGLALLRRLRVQKRRIRCFALGACVLLLGCMLTGRILRRDVLTVSAAENGRGVVLSLGDDALYVGSAASARDRTALRSALEASGLEAAILTSEKGAEALSAVYPKTAVLPEDRVGSTVTLTRGTLYLLRDSAGHPAVIYAERVTVLILSEGFDLADLPPEAAHPDLLVTLGAVENLTLAAPRAALVLGTDTYQNRLVLLAKGVQLPPPSLEVRSLCRAVTRYGTDWRFTSEPL